jgi:hypothetical protein
LAEECQVHIKQNEEALESQPRYIGDDEFLLLRYFPIVKILQNFKSTNFTSMSYGRDRGLQRYEVERHCQMEAERYMKHGLERGGEQGLYKTGDNSAALARRGCWLLRYLARK